MDDKSAKTFILNIMHISYWTLETISYYNVTDAQHYVSNVNVPLVTNIFKIKFNTIKLIIANLVQLARRLKEYG